MRVCSSTRCSRPPATCNAGKWNTLISTLLSFKRDYDNNKPIAKCLPDIFNDNKARYEVFEPY
jgi:arginine/lysine/ornithine decarboxylase